MQASSDSRPLPHSTPLPRRSFLRLGSQALLALPLLAEALPAWAVSPERRIRLAGPGSRYVPRVRAAFVRRKDAYGMLWPGEIYDGDTARRDYTSDLRAAERELDLQVDLRDAPIHSPAEADEWLAEASAARADGLLVILLDRQQHAWPTAAKAAASGIPSVVFAPIGAAFTTNTAPLASQPGVFIASTSDFAQARFGLKMLKTAARLREMRFVVLRGSERRDAALEHFGTKLRFLPARSFLEEYERTALTAELESLAEQYLRHAYHLRGPTQNDLHNGIRSFLVARNILEREKADGITMDCLGALGQTQVSLPCIAWSKMLDGGIPAACEADLGACVTHALVQFLFDRPGFQQDPVPETARQCLIGAHCTCPTRLKGFDQEPEPYALSFHHGKRDCVPVPVWRLGQRVTVLDVILPQPAEAGSEPSPTRPQMIVSTGTVEENVAVPPAGGCVVSVMVKLDTEPDLLRYPGFHQVFFYGDFKRDLLAYAQLHGLDAVVA